MRTYTSLAHLVRASSILIASAAASHAAISVYISAPDVEKAEDSGLGAVTISTETFNSLSPDEPGSFPGVSGYASSTIGATYTNGGGLSGGSGSKITANDQYGGNGEGNYLGVTGSSSVTITLDNSTYTNGAQYFGFYFTAGDANNFIEFYKNDVLVYTFSTASLLDILPQNTTVTAINGSVYNTNDYYGQPGTSNNTNEAYAYLHFIATGGDSYDKLVLNQMSGTPIFENDNHSIIAVAPTITPSSPLVGVVPEPSSALLGMLGAFGLLRRRR